MAVRKSPAKTTKTTKSTKSAKTTKRAKPAASETAASDLISARIRELGDWRGETLALVRRLIHEADPAIVEEWKWEVPVWSHDGIVCTGETYRQAVKLTFPKGASLEDPHGLFNAGLAGNVRRAIDIGREDEIDATAFRALIREAVAFNQARRPTSRRSSAKGAAER